MATINSSTTAAAGNPLATTVASQAAGAASTSSLTGQRGTIAQNFDQFLLLLTTQLKNQNPLEPLDTNQFTQQLVQFSSVEQQLKTNDNLSNLLSATRVSAATGALGFVGATVTAEGSTTRLRDGRAEWRLEASRAASAATITVLDKSNNVVFSRNGPLAAGPQGFVWDGRTTTGVTAPAGDYTIRVDARDVSGAAVTVASEIVGTVDSVDLSGNVPGLIIGGATVPSDRVKSIRR